MRSEDTYRAARRNYARKRNLIWRALDREYLDGGKRTRFKIDLAGFYPIKGEIRVVVPMASTRL